MNKCKTCVYWKDPEDDHRANSLCNPLDPQNNYKPMVRGFQCKVCKMPTQTFAESPVERDGFGMVDGSEYYSVLVTAEDFGCVRHKPVWKILNDDINQALRFQSESKTIGQFYNSQDKKYHLAEYEPYRRTPSVYLCGGHGNFSPSRHDGQRLLCSTCWSGFENFLK